MVAGEDLTASLRAQGLEAELVFDTVGAGIPELVALAGDGDRVVTIADYGAAAHGARFTGGALNGEPDGNHGLRLAADLAAQGRFRIPLRAVYPASEAAAAHATAEAPPAVGQGLDHRTLQAVTPAHGALGRIAVHSECDS